MDNLPSIDHFSQLDVLHERMKEINAKGPAAERR